MSVCYQHWLKNVSQLQLVQLNVLNAVTFWQAAHWNTFDLFLQQQQQQQVQHSKSAVQYVGAGPPAPECTIHQDQQQRVNQSKECSIAALTTANAICCCRASNTNCDPSTPPSLPHNNMPDNHMWYCRLLCRQPLYTFQSNCSSELASIGESKCSQGPPVMQQPTFIAVELPGAGRHAASRTLLNPLLASVRKVSFTALDLNSNETNTRVLG